MHCKWTGEQMLNLDFNGVTSRQAILDAVAEKAANTPDGEWIEGDGWNELIWEDSQEVITRRELDEVAPNNPVFLLHMSVHTIAANSLALEACGYTKDTPQPEGAEIGHYDDGELDGLLYENGALQPMLKAKPALTDAQHLESLVLIGQRLNSFGITSAIDANLNYKQMHIYNEARKQGKLTYRGNLMFYLDPQFGSFEDNLRRLEEMAVSYTHLNLRLTFLARRGQQRQPEMRGTPAASRPAPRAHRHQHPPAGRCRRGQRDRAPRRSACGPRARLCYPSLRRSGQSHAAARQARLRQPRFPRRRSGSARHHAGRTPLVSPWCASLPAVPIRTEDSGQNSRLWSKIGPHKRDIDVRDLAAKQYARSDACFLRPRSRCPNDPCPSLAFCP